MKNALRILMVVFTALAAATVTAKGGGPGGHMGDSGQANTNSQHLPGADRGLDRAQDRMSDQGLAHKKAAPKSKSKSKKVHDTKVVQKSTKPPAPNELGLPTPPGAPKPPTPPRP